MFVTDSSFRSSVVIATDDDDTGPMAVKIARIKRKPYRENSPTLHSRSNNTVTDASPPPRSDSASSSVVTETVRLAAEQEKQIRKRQQQQRMLEE